MQKLPNPVAGGIDNNGVIVELPLAAPCDQPLSTFPLSPYFNDGLCALAQSRLRIHPLDFRRVQTSVLCWALT